MDDRIIRNLLQRLQSLERRSVRFRVGEVTATSPNLQVSVGGADDPYTGCRSLAHQSIKTGDTVAVLMFGSDLLVLGRIVTAVQNQVIVAGVVGSTGSEDGGDTSLWSVNKTGTGVYVITFAPAFSAAPVVTASAMSWGAQTTAASPSSATISVFNTSTGVALDRGFHFTAVGPR